MRLLMLAALVAAAIAGPALAGRPSPQLRFRSGVEAVRVSAVVTEKRRPVLRLTAADFELFDNGVRQTVELVQPDVVGLDVILVLDASSSVWNQGPDATLKTAATAALGQLRPGDRAGLLHFTHHVSVVSRLTSDLARLAASMYDASGEGATSLLDAMATAVMIAEPGLSRRTLVIVCSDGIDTASWHRSADVLDLLRRSDAVVYVVVPRKNKELQAAVRLDEYPSMGRLLDDLTSLAGGRLIAAQRTDLVRAFRDIVSEFAQGYQLMFYPTGTEGPGWHRLELKVRGRAAEVKARRGYYRD